MLFYYCGGDAPTIINLQLQITCDANDVADRTKSIHHLIYPRRFRLIDKAKLKMNVTRYRRQTFK